MKTLVTGGAGFIGSNLVQQLLNDGHEVTILDNLSSGYLSNINNLKNINFINADIRNYDAVLSASTGMDVIFHLAASVGNKRSIDFPIQDAEINVIGTLNMLEAARKNKVRKIVVSSSAGIFGELKTLPIREDHPIEPDSPYGCTKLCEEKLSLSYSKLYDLDVVCLRYFNVYGPLQRFDAYGNVIPIFTFQLLRNDQMTIFGDGEQTRDFLNVKDVVQANIKAANKKDISGAFNIGSGTSITINKLMELLIDKSNIKANIKYGPPRDGDVLHSRADITAAKNTFGFEPVIDLEDGLAEYISWAQSEIAGK